MLLSISVFDASSDGLLSIRRTSIWNTSQSLKLAVNKYDYLAQMTFLYDDRG